MATPTQSGTASQNWKTISIKKKLSCCRLSISGLSCSSCVDLIQREVSSRPGVDQVLVDLEANEALVVYDGEVVHNLAIADVVNNVADKFTVEKIWEVVDVRITGMMCQSCVKVITNVLTCVEGVEDVVVKLEDQAARLLVLPKITNSGTIIDVINKMGDKFKALDINTT